MYISVHITIKMVHIKNSSDQQLHKLCLLQVSENVHKKAASVHQFSTRAFIRNILVLGGLVKPVKSIFSVFFSLCLSNFRITDVMLICLV